VPLEHPDLGVTVPYPGAPFRMSSPWTVARAPRLGEHTSAVVADWAARPDQYRTANKP
jgi:crotonobetainyl-CoA:carnitine CoA-transferase CaiB-like acyl-CoA transferase